MPQIDVRPDIYERLQQLFPNNGLCEQVVVSALSEWIDWLEGKRRPTSISELETYRIAAIYRDVLTDQLPTADLVGRQFGLPMGRSRYLIQGLNYRFSALMEQRRIEAVLQALEKGKWTQDGVTCVIQVDPSCSGIVSGFLHRLLDDGVVGSPVTGKFVMGYVRYDLGSAHHNSLCEALKGHLASKYGEDQK